MLKVALVGIGGISTTHISVWEAQENAELVALCDARREQLEKYSHKHCYTDFDEMLSQEDIDILDICLPTFLHASFAIKAMERGIHVLCEKPISLELEDVAQMYGAAQRNGVKLMVAQVLRFWPEYEAIRKMYDEGTYGKLLSGSMSRLHTIPGNGWMAQEERSGLVPFDLHIHDLDFLVYAFGTPTVADVHRSKRPDQDYLRATYEFGDFFVSAEAAWYAAPYPFAARFIFQFERAVAALEGGKLTVYEKGGKSYCPVDGDSGNAVSVPGGSAYAKEIAYFVDCVLHDTAPDKVKPQELESVIRILRSL